MAARWLVAGAGGAVVAALYFWGLWWTTRRVQCATRPLVFLAGSFLVRAALAALALVGLAGGDVRSLLAGLAGFLVVRGVLVRIVRDPGISGRRARPLDERA